MAVVREWFLYLPHLSSIQALEENNAHRPHVYFIRDLWRYFTNDKTLWRQIPETSEHLVSIRTFNPIKPYTYRPCLHLVLRCVSVDRITSRRGRHIPVHTWCVNPSFLSCFLLRGGSMGWCMWAFSDLIL